MSSSDGSFLGKELGIAIAGAVVAAFIIAVLGIGEISPVFGGDDDDLDPAPFVSDGPEDDFEPIEADEPTDDGPADDDGPSEGELLDCRVQPAYCRADIVRLDGSFDITLEFVDTLGNNPFQQVFTRRWDFTPDCDRGACAGTVVSDTSVGGTGMPWDFVAQGDAFRVAVPVSTNDCFDPFGVAVEAGIYDVTPSVTVQPIEVEFHSDAPLVTAIAMSYQLVNRLNRPSIYGCLQEATVTSTSTSYLR